MKLLSSDACDQSVLLPCSSSGPLTMLPLTQWSIAHVLTTAAVVISTTVAVFLGIYELMH